MEQRSNEVLILTGPPGSGKTTVARLVTARRERAVHLESDVFWHFITSGYVAPWKPESHEQNTLVMSIVAEAAGRYATGGYFTVIDGIVQPRWFLEPMRSQLVAAGLGLAYVVLRPPLAVALQRATVRPRDGMADRDVIEQLWRGFANLDSALERHVIDSSELTAEQTATAIDERLHLGTLTLRDPTNEP